MENLFEVIDPRGITVHCTEDAWQSHILDEHPEMHGEIGRVKRAIEKPYLFIYQDRDYPDRNIYYLPDKSRQYYIKVVVKFFNNEYGEVITAFKADSPKSGEYIIWPLSND